MSGSKFAGLFPTDQTAESADFRNSETSERQNAESAEVQTSAKIGRPANGKKSDPNYRQVTVYLTTRTHRRCKEMALHSDGERDVSEIIEDALLEYFARQGKA